MEVPEPVRRIIGAARLRLTLAGVTRRVVGWVGISASLAAGLAAVARVWVIEWADVAALGMLIVAVVAAVAWSLLARPSEEGAAIAVDRRLGGFDRVTTALELGRSPEATAEISRQLDSAAAWSEAREVTEVVALVPDRRVWGLSLLSVVVLAALMAIPAPTDAALAERQADREAISREADRLEEMAEEAPPEVADRLRELVEELREASDLETALEELGDARQELTEALNPAALSRRTGLEGLEKSFEQQPLSEGESAAEQLRNLANEVESGDMSGVAEAVSQLRERSADAAGVDPELSDALGEAADALTQMAAGTGDPAEAAESVREAAEAVEGASDAVAADAATAEAAGEVAESQQRLSESGQGQGQGQGQGPGGAGGGNGAGGQQGAGSGSGSGGSGMGTGGTGDEDPDRAPDRSSVFDPADEALGDRERVDLPSSGEQGEVRGLTDGRGGAENLPLTPYSSRFGEYRDTALNSLDSLAVPSSVRDVVRDYFTRLQP